MDLTESKIKSEIKYEGRIVNIRDDTVRLPDGRSAMREVCEHPGGVAVAGLFPDGTILLVRQYRYPTGQEMLEIPAGKLEKGEDPIVCGLRELAEETGYTAGKTTSLGYIHPSPGFLNEIIHLYLAQELSPKKLKGDEDEFLEVKQCPLSEAVKLIMENKITDAKTIAAVMKIWNLR